ncbi:MAG: HlyD family efflux transporter periplasmic adaptor subunit, partial [Spirochaetales bacterium]|nr:HlyD family efflux transporter periplasmic adaptor subunit [Spirochaetales bacterium]
IIAAVVFFFNRKASTEVVSIKSYTKAKVYSGELTSTTEASGTVVLPVEVTLTSTEDGYAEELYVEEGDSITPNDILATLDVPDLEDQRDELTVSLEQAKIELESIKIQNKFTLRDLKIEISRLKEDVKDQEDDVADLKKLTELKSSRQTDLDDAIDALQDLYDELEDDKQDLEDAQITNEIDVRKQEASINMIQTNLKTVEDKIDETKIQSPISGEVLSINEDLAIPGSPIEQADELIIVADRSKSFIDFDVYEQYTDQLEIGDEMTVTIGSDTMRAKIVKIGKIATMDDDGLAAMVTVRAKPETEETLTPGASAVASITLGVQNNVLMLQRGAYLTTGNQKWVYKIKGDKAYKTSVTFGEIQGTEVQILSGLSAGDKIITSSYQSFIDEDVIVLK